MKSSQSNQKFLWWGLISASLAMVLASPALARNDFPERAANGMHLLHDTESMAVYASDEATLEGYDKVAITDVTVAFKKNWKRDYNREEVALSGRVSDEDMERMKNKLATEFLAVFTEALEDGGYETTNTAGSDVLILQPSILNLTVTAPDTNAAVMRTTYMTSAGEMTLNLEVFDSMSSAFMYQVIDAQRAGDHGFPQMGSRVTNKAQFDQVLRLWADRMVKALDAAHEASKK